MLIRGLESAAGYQSVVATRGGEAAHPEYGQHAGRPHHHAEAERTAANTPEEVLVVAGAHQPKGPLEGLPPPQVFSGILSDRG